MYRDWDAVTPDWLAVCPVELPGRGRRFGEPLCADANLLANKLIDELLSQCDQPFILFGHSMGALLAHEIALQLIATGQPKPAMLIVSSREPPHCKTQAIPMRSQLPTHDFLQQVRRYGGLSLALEESQELLDLFLPVLRNDFALVENYLFNSKEILSCPLFAVSGNKEPDYALESLVEWERYSKRWAGSRQFFGGHFYLNDSVQRLQLLNSIRELVVSYCGEQLTWRKERSI